MSDLSETSQEGLPPARILKVSQYEASAPFDRRKDPDQQFGPMSAARQKPKNGPAEINLRIEELKERVRRIYREIRLSYQIATPQLKRAELQRN